MSSKQKSRPTLPHTIAMPILFGLSAFILLFALIKNGSIDNELVSRYLAGHTVSRVTTAMLLVGLSSLGFVFWDVIRQRGWLSRIRLVGEPAKDGSLPAGVETPEPTTAVLLSQLEKYKGRTRRTYLWRRLYTALDFVRRNGSADGLEEELKYQEGFLQSVMKKLGNENFVKNAPEKVVEMEKKKKADAEEKIKAIRNKLSSF